MAAFFICSADSLKKVKVSKFLAVFLTLRGYNNKRHC